MFSQLLAELSDWGVDALFEFWHDPENVNELLIAGHEGNTYMPDIYYSNICILKEAELGTDTVNL
jgi:hypothetical protein